MALIYKNYLSNLFIKQVLISTNKYMHYNKFLYFKNIKKVKIFDNNVPFISLISLTKTLKNVEKTLFTLLNQYFYPYIFIFFM